MHRKDLGQGHAPSYEDRKIQYLMRNMRHSHLMCYSVPAQSPLSRDVSRYYYFPLTKAVSFTLHSNKKLEINLESQQVTTPLMLHLMAAFSFHQMIPRQTAGSLILVYFVFKKINGIIWSQLFRHFSRILYWVIISMDG